MTDIPKIGCGTWTYDDAAAYKYVRMAIDAGFRLIDTASYYGNEAGVGSAVNSAGIARSELWVQSKLWRGDMGYDKALTALQRSLDRMGLDHLDCYLIHWPAVRTKDTAWRRTNAETWRALEEALRQGLVKHIGVCNFTPEYLQPLLEDATVPPMLNQIEFHPGFAQLASVEFCRERSIALEAWSPFARGDVFHNACIKSLAEKYGCSMANVCLAWIAGHGLIPIVKSENRERLADDLAFENVVLEPEDCRLIDGIPFFGRLGYDPETIELAPEGAKYSAFAAMPPKTEA